MAKSLLNQEVLVSGAEYFNVLPLNSYTQNVGSTDRAKVVAEHEGIVSALKGAGVKVLKTSAPVDCHAGIFTANWAFCYGDVAVMANLPAPRKKEEADAERALHGLGKRIIRPPYRFSGQGDALRCGEYLFTASGYRTDSRMPEFLAKTFRDLEVIDLQTVPELDEYGRPVTNKISGWPDSFFYDIDLALSILREDLIGWCPEAFTPESQKIIRSMAIEKIEISAEEAIRGMACNLVSTGEVAVMSGMAPQYRAAIEAHGIKTVTPEISELSKSGGCIRCTTLTLA